MEKDEPLERTGRGLRGIQVSIRPPLIPHDQGSLNGSVPCD